MDIRKQIRWKYHRDRTGKSAGAFTLVELLVASALLILAVSGILLGYLNCMELNEVSRNFSTCQKAVESKIETIRVTSFDLVKSTHHQQTFDVANFSQAKGVTYVDDSVPNLLEIIVSISWTQKNGRLFGEDANLNGTVDGAEDKNGNGVLDSPVQLSTYLFRRQLPI